VTYYRSRGLPRLFANNWSRLIGALHLGRRFAERGYLLIPPSFLRILSSFGRDNASGVAISCLACTYRTNAVRLRRGFGRAADEACPGGNGPVHAAPTRDETAGASAVDDLSEVTASEKPPELLTVSHARSHCVRQRCPTVIVNDLTDRIGDWLEQLERRLRVRESPPRCRGPRFEADTRPRRGSNELRHTPAFRARRRSVAGDEVGLPAPR
jgi:hypothetical protein